MGKHKGPGGKNGKGPANQRPVKVIRRRQKEIYTLEQKAYVCKLRSEGHRQKDILKAIEEIYGITPTPSTLSTFYNVKNKVRYGRFGQKDSCMASVKTSINVKQRTTTMLDTEFSLSTMLKNTLNIGERPNCPMCEGEIMDGHQGLLDHLKEKHVTLAEQTGRDETEGSPATNKVFVFTASTSSTEAASVNLTAPRTSPSVSFSFEEGNVVDVSLGGDSDGDVADDVLSAAPAPSSVNDVLMATPDHESSRAAARAAAPAISLASATAAAASGMWVSPQEETMLVARFTTLNLPDATSSPSQKIPKSTSQTQMRPTGAGAKESRGKYTEFGQSSSEETLEETSDEEYDDTKGK